MTSCVDSMYFLVLTPTHYDFEFGNRLPNGLIDYLRSFEACKRQLTEFQHEVRHDNVKYEVGPCQYRILVVPQDEQAELTLERLFQDGLLEVTRMNVTANEVDIDGDQLDPDEAPLLADDAPRDPDN